MNTASTSTVPPPQMTFDPSTLPLPHLVSLRSKLSQIIESLSALTHLISGDDTMGMGMASWPDILAKYSNLLAQSHTLINTLSGAHLPQPARRPGEARRERTNPYEGIVLHPFLLSTAGVVYETQGPLENLLSIQTHPQVIKRWDASVRRFVERRKGGGGGTVDASNAGKVASIVVGVDPIREAQDIVREMTAVKEGHDARIERAMRVVEELKERWDWKMRVGIDGDIDDDLFGDDQDEEDEGGTRTGMLVDSGDEAMGTQTQSMLGSQRTATVHMDTATQQSRMETQGSVVTQPPPPSQEVTGEDEDIYSASDDDDDDDLEDVMED